MMDDDDRFAQRFSRAANAYFHTGVVGHAGFPVSLSLPISVAVELLQLLREMLVITAIEAA